MNQLHRDFFPVSKKDFLHNILALVAHFDRELQQMDVKTVFFNGDLEEVVYIKQPEGSPLAVMNIWFASLINLYIV